MGSPNCHRRFIAALLALAAPFASADRYFTWVDAQGEVRTTLVKDGKLRGEAEEAPSGAATQDVQGIPPSAVTPAPGAPRTAAPKSNARFGLPAEDPVFNLANFPDAEALEAAGYVREGDPSPFYTWTDATGTLHNSPFNPGKEKNLLRKKEREAESVLLPGQKHNFTDAQVSRRDAGLPSGARQHAAAVLGLQGAAPELIDRFAETCCETFRRGDVHRLDRERGTSVRIDATAPVFDFPTGRSPYRIVQLPEPGGVLALTIRSYVDGSVFLPTLVFLDAEWRPVRLVTDIGFTYEPESWYRYGYLEASLPIESEAGERWLVVMSKGEDLQGQGASASRSSDLPGDVQPSRSGEIELSLGPAAY